MEINSLKLKMDSTIESLEKRFTTIRAGRANPSSLDGVFVNYYGSNMPIKQVATVSVPEARQLLIKPFDKSSLSSIEKAIFDANLGYTPNNDGETIRIIIPQLTEDRRIELVKQVKSMAEDAKVAVRNNRREALDELDKSENAEDMKKSLENEVQEIVNKYNKIIDEKTKEKEVELMSV
ncbi:MAG: ribosome recycling factor [Bacilli bacterium]|nr:ribosome recycling factor [Bacilli bacterium]